MVKGTRNRDISQPLRAVPHQDADDDDDELVVEGGERRRVQAGEYDARVVLKPEKSVRFRRRVVLFQFELDGIGPHHGARLAGFANLSHSGTVLPESKLARWMRLLAEFSGERWDRVSRRRFQDFLFRVTVETVEQNHKRNPLARVNQYERVDEIVGVVAKLEKSTAREKR
jgi:hypothetical protein